MIDGYEVSKLCCNKCGEPILMKVNGTSKTMMGVIHGAIIQDGTPIDEGKPYHLHCLPRDLELGQ